MRLGRVIGRVVLSKKDAGLDRGGFLIIVSPMDRAMYARANAPRLSKTMPNLIVYDIYGAAVGDIVSYVEGSEATAPFDGPIPIDSCSVGIVDRYTYNPEVE